MPNSSATYWIALTGLVVTLFIAFISWWITAQITKTDRINALTERVTALEIECDRDRRN